MADQLNIKVSEEKVQEAIDTLTTSIEKMEGYLASLVSKREQLEQSYIAPVANIAFNAIKKRENEAATSIAKYKAQKEKLQAYLDLMNKTNSEVTTTYEESLNKSNEFFNS